MINCLSDEELLQHSCQGDTFAFEQIYLRLRPAILRFVLSRTRDTSKAEDVVQETFCRIWSRRNYRIGTASARTYIFNVALCIIREYSRVDRRAVSADCDNILFVASPPQVDVVELSELAVSLQSARASLSVNQAIALACVYDQGLKPQQAAAIVGCGEKAFRRRLEVARHRLRTAMRAKDLVRAKIPRGEREIFIRHGRAL